MLDNLDLLFIYSIWMFRMVNNTCFSHFGQRQPLVAKFSKGRGCVKITLLFINFSRPPTLRIAVPTGFFLTGGGVRNGQLQSVHLHFFAPIHLTSTLRPKVWRIDLPLDSFLLLSSGFPDLPVCLISEALSLGFWDWLFWHVILNYQPKGI